jgi:hypothetical protein
MSQSATRNTTVHPLRTVENSQARLVQIPLRSHSQRIDGEERQREQQHHDDERQRAENMRLVPALISCPAATACA